MMMMMTHISFDVESRHCTIIELFIHLRTNKRGGGGRLIGLLTQLQNRLMLLPRRMMIQFHHQLYACLMCVYSYVT